MRSDSANASQGAGAPARHEGSRGMTWGGTGRANPSTLSASPPPRQRVRPRGLEGAARTCTWTDRATEGRSAPSEGTTLSWARASKPDRPLSPHPGIP